MTHVRNTHTAGCTLRLCSKMHAVLNTWRATEFYFLIKLFTFTRYVLASRPAEVQSCLFSLTQENACGSCRQRNTAQHSPAQQRPDLALHLPSVTVAVALPLWVKWAASFAFAFAVAVALPPVGGTIKKVQARISPRTTLCRPARFNTLTYTHTYLQLSYVSSFILILGTPTLFTLWTGSEHHETLPHNVINSRPLVNNQIPNLSVPCGKKKIN